MDCTNKSGNQTKLLQDGLLKLVFGDETLGVYWQKTQSTDSGKKRQIPSGCIFSYGKGLESLVSGGKEWIYRAPAPTFWRATTDNDRGNRFHLKSGMWFAADAFINCVNAEVIWDGEEINLPVAPENNIYTGLETVQAVAVRYTYETITSPATKVTVMYEVRAEGKINVTVHYFGKEGLPQLPVFGLRFIMPTCADKFVYEGLSGETYPDRKAGGCKGTYEVQGLPVTPYLRPQDCGMHMDTKWVDIYRSTVLDNTRKEQTQSSLCFEADKEMFAFSCLPYTAQELENAIHMEELPPARRTVLCICGAVRGVGGIDSWGADVENAYHIDAEKDIVFSFSIKPQI